MILETIGQIISLVLVLILAFFVLRYRNWKVAVVLVIGMVNIGAGQSAERESVFYAALSNINAGLLSWLLYDYMKLVHERRTFRSRTQTEALSEAADYAVIGIELSGKILAWNNAAEKMFGLTERQAKGQDISIILPDDKHTEHKQLITSIKRGQGTKLVTERCGKDGKRIKVEMSVVPIRDPVDNAIIGGTALYKRLK